MAVEKENERGGGSSGLVFVGILLLSLAIGIFTGEVAVALLAGLGVGFIALAIMRVITGEW